MGTKADGQKMKMKMKISFINDTQLETTTGTGKEILTDGEVPYFAVEGLIYDLSDMPAAQQNGYIVRLYKTSGVKY